MSAVRLCCTRKGPRRRGRGQDARALPVAAAYPTAPLSLTPSTLFPLLPLFPPSPSVSLRDLHDLLRSAALPLPACEYAG
ncbi:hypothetical protein BS50DRAFT_357109 [Corynespora cassiicola Philippines]|uniref:Uncharacterized protein n=1 Tax=Corynespora cassiicola Philippines TaxID=1448308 RepID=A0A2T2NRT2_CORCC|nr:hypothetical protein BS50DRAFT_357109 [Corynespora cassiicola Philippines]